MKFKILSDVYKDMLEAFTPADSKNPLTMFHVGGDEVNFKCWEREPEVLKWLNDRNMETIAGLDPSGYLNLWSAFQEKATNELIKANKNTKFKDGVILWTSELTKPDVVSK